MAWPTPHQWIEFVAEGVELFSFFLITVDLYGAGRLEKASEWLLAISAKSNQKLPGWQSKLSLIGFKCCVVSIVYTVFLLFFLWSKRDIARAWETEPAGFAIQVVLVGASLLILVFAVGTSFALRFVSSLLAKTAAIIRKWHLEYTMIIAGAALFSFSKLVKMALIVIKNE